MAYAVKYVFTFQSVGGTTREIRILKDGYSGDPIRRALGRAPILKKQQNGPVHGTSLEMYAECHVDQEFIEFYTSDPKEYRVDLYAGNALLWQGWITPELYSEPDIAPPYDVQVIATDGVGELKLYDFAAQGMVSLRAMLTYLLGKTGLSTDVFLVSSLKAGSAGAGALLDMEANFDYLVGKTCYEALSYLLTTLHATITWWGGHWLLVRENNVTFTSGKVRYFNTAGNSALLANSVQELGSMYQDPAWPVGQLSTVIDPAKNKIVVQAPWHPVTALKNSDMTQDSNWSKIQVSYDSTKGAYWFPQNAITTGELYQAVAFGGLRVPMRMTLSGCGSSEAGSGFFGQGNGWLGLVLRYVDGSNNVYYLGTDGDGNRRWEQATPGQTPVRAFKQDLLSVDVDRENADRIELDIPALAVGGAYPSGTLTVSIFGGAAWLFSAHLDVILNKGYQDILRIDNGARGEGDDTEVAIGRVTSDVAYYQAFIQGILLNDGALITAFSDANFTTGMDFLSFISRDYARSVALPRARVEGTVSLEASVQLPPLVFTKDGLDYWLETWSWNLYEDELQISARTLPTATLTVESETITEAGGTASTGSSAGGASSTPVPQVAPNYFEKDGTFVTGIKLKDEFDAVRVPGLRFGDGVSEPDLYVDTVEDTQGNPVRVLRSPLALITAGDQIVEGGEPLSDTGGGGGGTNLTGYISVPNIASLPDPGLPTLGYLVGTNLYVYVGNGGDTRGGKYQNCGPFRGPQGNSGYTGAAGELEVVNNLTEGGETAALSAEQGKILKGLLDEGYLYVGIATPTTDPGTPAGKVCYLATTPGTYVNFGDVVVKSGEAAIIKTSGAGWVKDETGMLTARAVYEKTGNYDEDGELVAGTPSTIVIEGPFSSGTKLVASATGTAIVADGAIKLRNSANTTLASLTMNGDAITVTLNADTSDLRFLISGANITGSGSVSYNVQMGAALAMDELESIEDDLIENMNVINVSNLFPTGGEGGTNVYTRANARAKITVATELRKFGAILTYLTADGWVLEEFVGSATSSWNVDGNWRDLTAGSNVYVVTMESGETRANVRNKVPAPNRKTGVIVVYYDGLEWCLDQFIASDLAYWTSNQYASYWVNLLRQGADKDKEHSLEYASGLAEQGIAVTGTPGQRGAVYSVDLNSPGLFVLSFEFKFPKDIQQTTGTVQLAKLDNLGTPAKGGFCLDIFKSLPTARAPFAQPNFGAGLNWYPVAQKNNNFATRFRPSGTANKQFAGKDAVAIRYAGDISQAANQDVVLTINDTGLTVKHATDNTVIVSEAFPTSKDMNEWAGTLATKCASGGAYAGLIEFDFFLVEGHSTDDLLRVSDIPLVGDYSSQAAAKGLQAFPCFLPYYDDEWHRIDVRLDWSKADIRNALTCLYDGLEISTSATLATMDGNGKFEATFTLGGEDILVRNFKFKTNTNKTGVPKIIVCMTHDQADGVYNPSTPDAYMTIGRAQWILDTFKRNGFEFVGLQQIAAYINGNGAMPEKCFTIIFDDKYYLADWDNPLQNKFRRLLMENNAPASFALAPSSIDTQAERDAILLDRHFFQFHAHDSAPSAEKYGYADFVSHFAGLFKACRNAVGISNVYTYMGGLYDVNVLHLLRHFGICYSSVVGGNYVSIVNSSGTAQSRRANTFTSKAFDALAQPRLSIDDNDVTETELQNYLTYLDSI